jgi:hypothetical protein
LLFILHETWSNIADDEVNARIDVFFNKHATTYYWNWHSWWIWRRHSRHTLARRVWKRDYLLSDGC